MPTNSNRELLRRVQAERTLVHASVIMTSALPPSKALYIGMEVVIAVSSVIGNVMVVWAVRINRSLRDTTFCFIVSLALADIAVGALVIPLAITISIGLQTHFYSCLFFVCTVLVLTQSSILALLAIAIDRYLRVKIPMSYKRVVTPRRAGTAVLLCWLVSIIVGLTPMFGWNNLHVLLNNGTLITEELEVTCEFETVISMNYMVYFNFFGWVLPPLLLMLAIYVEIFYMIHKQLNKKVTASHTDPRRYFGKELKLAKSLALVLFLFAVSWLPLHILNCITLFFPGCKTSMSLIYIAIILTHGNSAVNPIVYAFRIKKFHTAFRKIWKQYMLCQDPIGRLPQRGSQRGQSRETRLRQNDDDDDV
ncbi:adenosine receptor A1-like isoform X2 [Girardinichthys multiradiatus]|uniref:adenosine receptor A1-like isoform X2 n=1 Tax=Girardinichthys multiradiatus TaxID=208333 RepID=UPI001FACCDA2|nr:adenosine receptor A1-like isoform X2 [Girardinichthys multiradiatus]